MKSLLLDRTAWDIVLDSKGNIAIAEDPYSIAQNVATACKTFLGECIYDTTIGIPWFNSIIGKFPPLSFIKSALESEAKSVLGVKDALVVFVDFEERVLTGQIQVITDSGIEIVNL